MGCAPENTPQGAIAAITRAGHLTRHHQRHHHRHHHHHRVWDRSVLDKHAYAVFAPQLFGLLHGQPRVTDQRSGQAW